MDKDWKHKKSGTFRDVSFTGIPDGDAKQIDSECIGQKISRREWIFREMERNPDNFKKIFAGTKGFKGIIAGQKIGDPEP